MPITTTFRQVTLDASVNGGQLTEAFSARMSFGLDESVSQATVTMAREVAVNYDDNLIISCGAGNNAQRFDGLVRRKGFSLDGGFQIEALGQLTRAAEYKNGEDPTFMGGLTIQDLTGSPTATGGQLIAAVFGKVGISPASIEDNGVVLNTSGIDFPFVWSAGTDPEGLRDMQQPGQSALDYIQNICRIMVSASGMARVFESTNGIYVTIVSGRPTGGSAFTFTEGVDIFSGRATREYPIGNSILVTGYDYGDGGPDGFGGPEYAVTIASNPFQPGRVDVTPFHSPMIEKSLTSDPGGGMDCQTVGEAILGDYNRETVRMSARVYSDVLIGPGQTISIVSPTMGTTEPMWVRGLVVAVDPDATPAFYQDLDLIGGGL